MLGYRNSFSNAQTVSSRNVWQTNTDKLLAHFLDQLRWIGETNEELNGSKEVVSGNQPGSPVVPQLNGLTDMLKEE